MRFRTTIAQIGRNTGDQSARATWDRLSYGNRSWHVLHMSGAKTDETRDCRIAGSIEALREGRPR